MFKGNKILFIIFFILLLVTIGEVGYYFILKPSSEKQTTTESPKTTTTIIDIEPTESSEPAVSSDRTKLEPINLLLRLIDISNNSVKLKDGVLLVDNSDNDEFIGFGPKDPIIIDSPFRLRLKFKREGEGNNVQLTLTGKRLTKPTQWWEGLHEIYFMDFHDEVGIEIRDGKSSKAWGTTLHEINRGETFYIEFMDSLGKQFAVIDKEGTIIRTIDVTKLEGKTLPNGLFPEKKMTVGVLVGPKAKMRIDEFVLTFAPK